MTTKTEIKINAGGNPFGVHRVIEPKGVLPQPALKVNNDMSVMWDNEMMVDVDILNVDSASFTQIEDACGHDEEKIKHMILGIVGERGKQQNPVTGSGGMFIGRVHKIGPKFPGKDQLKEGDKIASLVSLSLTPLKIESILKVNKDTDQVNVKARAILFASAIYAKLPTDLPEPLALAVLDVAGAPAQTAKLVRPGDTVVIIGAAGKSGVMCSYEAKKRAGCTGKIIGITSSDSGLKKMKEYGFCDVCLKLSATDAIACYEAIMKETDGKLADLIINCVNVPNTEMSSIMMCRDNGTVYFFTMATSFTKAALGAEGIGKDVNMIIGNGYTKDHAEITLNLLRESPKIRKIYEETYA
jgi:L-erythro-3,5-diaminohexanoate dehydrogenase